MTVVRQVATYQEVTQYWDLSEVLDALEALDIMDDLTEDQAEADRKAAERKARR